MQPEQLASASAGHGRRQEQRPRAWPVGGGDECPHALCIQWLHPLVDGPIVTRPRERDRTAFPIVFGFQG